MHWLYWAVANGIRVFDPGDVVTKEIDGVEHWMLVRVIPNGKQLTDQAVAALRAFDNALMRVHRPGARYRGLHVLVMDGADIENSSGFRLDGVAVDRETWLRFLQFVQPDDWYERRYWPVEPQRSDTDVRRGEMVLGILRKLSEETGLSLHYQLRYMDAQGWLPKDVSLVVQSGAMPDEDTLVEVCARLSDRHLARLREFLRDAQWMVASDRVRRLMPAVSVYNGS